MAKIFKERPKHRNYSSSARSSSQSDLSTISIPTSNTPSNIPPIPPLGGVGDIGIFNRGKFQKQNDEKIVLKKDGYELHYEVLELVEQLNKLPTATRKRLVSELALGLKQETSTTSSRDVELWLKAVTEELAAVLRSQFYVGAGMKQSVVGFENVEEFMRTSGLSKCTAIQRSGMYKLLAQLLVKHAQGIAEHVGQPLSLKFVLSCSSAVPGLFDNAYPGYLASGMASVVVAAMKT